MKHIIARLGGLESKIDYRGEIKRFKRVVGSKMYSDVKNHFKGLFGISEASVFRFEAGKVKNLLSYVEGSVGQKFPVINHIYESILSVKYEGFESES